MVTRLVSFGGKWPGTMAPLIVPPPSRSQPQISGGVLAAASAARCQASATLLPVSAGFRVSHGRSAFLEALRPLPEVDYVVHAGKIPNP
jgi:hypothetical protein